MRGYGGGRRNSLKQGGFQLSFVSPRPDPFDSISPEGNLPIFWDKKRIAFWLSMLRDGIWVSLFIAQIFNQSSSIHSHPPPLCSHVSCASSLWGFPGACISVDWLVGSPAFLVLLQEPSKDWKLSPKQSMALKIF